MFVEAKANIYDKLVKDSERRIRLAVLSMRVMLSRQNTVCKDDYRLFIINSTPGDDFYFKFDG